MTETLIGEYRDYEIFSREAESGERMWIARSEKYLQEYGDRTKAPDEAMLRTAKRALEKVYSYQGNKEHEQLKEKA